MKYLLSHDTAGDYWTHHDIHQGMEPLRFEVRFEDPLNERDLDNGFPFLPWTTFPLHVLVNDRGAMRASSRVVAHHRVHMPPRSVMRLQKGLYVCSPEMFFLQHAMKASLVDLLLVGHSLCGTYAIDRQSGERIARLPRTDVKSLVRFADRASGAYGAQKARKAARYLSDGSASPMETKLALLFCLPVSKGGFGVPLPLFNHEIVVDGRRRKCDLCWPDQKLALEYDSEEWHADRERLNADSARRAELESQGLHVISVTGRQVYDEALFETLATTVIRLLGIRRRSTVAEEWQRRNRLRKALLG